VSVCGDNVWIYGSDIYIYHPGLRGVLLEVDVDHRDTYTHQASHTGWCAIHRIHVEEAALSRKLGDACTSYAVGPERVIPLVW
jgi:hypothetical protein